MGREGKGGGGKGEGEGGRGNVFYFALKVVPNFSYNYILKTKSRFFEIRQKTFMKISAQRLTPTKEDKFKNKLNILPQVPKNTLIKKRGNKF